MRELDPDGWLAKVTLLTVGTRSHRSLLGEVLGAALPGCPGVKSLGTSSHLVCTESPLSVTARPLRASVPAAAAWSSFCFALFLFLARSVNHKDTSKQNWRPPCRARADWVAGSPTLLAGVFHAARGGRAVLPEPLTSTQQGCPAQSRVGPGSYSSSCPSLVTQPRAGQCHSGRGTRKG